MTDLELPGYQIDALHAEHRLGSAYRAVWQAERREVELLLLNTSLRQYDGLEQRFLRAARQAMRLSADMRGIVPPLDAGSHNGQLYLARDFSPADGLDDYLVRLQKRDAVVPLDTLRKTLLALALRLRAFQRHGIVHGNLTTAALKPTRDAGLLLTDLGLPLLNAQEATSLPEGTSQILPFLSPEQMLERGVGEATDIFAFGVVAYTLATGRLPRAGSLWKEGLKAYWAQSPRLVHDRRPDVGPQLSAIIHKALSIRPQNRFRSAAELADALQRVILDASPASLATATTRAEGAAVDEPGASGAYGDAAMAITVQPDKLEVAPGDEGILHLTITNQSAEPENYTVALDGVPRQWISIPQEFVRLVPGAVAEITIKIVVPLDSSAESGDHVLSIKVATTGGAPHTEIIESSLTILPFQELLVEMQPQSIRQGQSVSLTLKNSGNEPLTLAVEGEDPNDTLRFGGGEEEMVLAAGAVKSMALRVSAREQPLAGRVQTFPFFVTITSQEGMSEQLEGDVTVAPVVPTWLAAILMIGLLGLCGAAGVWLWPRVVGGPLVLTEERTQTPVSAIAATASPTATAAATATDAVDAALATVESGGATETATATVVVTEQDITATATVAEERTPTGTPTTESVEADATPSPTVTTTAVALETPEPPTATGDEIALQVQVGDRDEIWTVARDGGEPRLLLTNARQPVWSPDGRRIAFTRPAEDEEPPAEMLYVATASGTELSALTEEEMRIGGLSWSRDGSQIAFHAAPAGATGTSEFQIFLAQSDGSGVRQLTTSVDDYANMWPLWSPVDTELLAYGVPQSGSAGAQLRLYNTQNQNMTVLFTENEAQLTGGQYDWSPDGQQVVFSLSSGDASQLFVLEATVALYTPLTTEQFLATSPTWSPDGQLIAYIAGDGEDQEAVAIVDVSGDLEQTVVSADSLEALFWSPDGSELGVAGDFNGEGAVQLWIYEIADAESVALIEDLSDLPLADAAGTMPALMSAAWRPRAP